VAEAVLATPRRDFVVRLARAAGVAPAVLGLLEGTGTALARAGGLGGAEDPPAQRASAGFIPARAKDETDVAILGAALAIEHHAIALYEAGLQRGLFPAGLHAYAVEFRGDHLGHRDTQIAIMEERGARPPAARSRYELGPLVPGDEFVRQALQIEVYAQEAYTALMSRIDTRDYLLSAAFILVDEVRHMTVWRRVLGLRIY
jgi:ferritin-like protein